MNEKYLWDKSGEPDPEIQQLEQILGTLRYEPKQLELPDDVQLVRRNRYLPLVAIAATLLVALLAAGLWLRVRNKTASDLQNTKLEIPAVPTEARKPTPENKPTEELAMRPNKPNREVNPIVRTVRHPKTYRDSTLTAKEHEEAVEAKEQLMMALRLASEKLNLAQRKAQSPATNQIRNQHKVG
jgi:negative regulator of sigma E activity